MRKLCPVLIALCVLFLCACSNNAEKKETPIRFTFLPSSETGIKFINTVTENDSVNILTNEYMYTGSGVGIADFNNDSLPDVFMGANQASCRLYLNKGSMAFEDITQKAGLESSFWASGISIVDINSDGFDDVYVCASGAKNPEQRKNRLYVNNGNLTFTEQAAAYGLADTGYSTQAVFFDYDKDGDLDMYLLNHLLYALNSNSIVEPEKSGHEGATDKLYRNEGKSNGKGHPVFTDVSAAAGIKDFAYGLGMVVSDFNNDTWPDLYIANDYIANDMLLLNNKNGTFSNRIASAVRHQSYSSMGVDAGDVNNDGLQDLISLDMLPETNERKKMMYTFMNNDRYEIERRMGYEPTFMRNMLQVNNGIRTVNDTTEPFFSELGQLAGISETDWSWSVLMADLDNDGWKDVHITNGFGRDMLDNDYVAAFKDNTQLSQYKNQQDLHQAALKKLDENGSLELTNYCYRNNGDLTFTNVSSDAGINTVSLSNGAAYADLDNDGDLDLVVNNINKEAFVMRNEANSRSESRHHYLTVQLKGDSLNPHAFGARVSAYAGGRIQTAEQNPVRGYLSAVDTRLHLGLGNAAKVDSLVVIWPNNKKQVLKDIAADQRIVLHQKDAAGENFTLPFTGNTLFEEVAVSRGIDFRHTETYFSDFNFQQLLPQKYSQLGPFISDGDVNGDGLTDFFVGGAYNQQGRFYLQQADGRFISKELSAGEKNEEDLGSVLFDADADKDLDLFVNSGGYEYEAGSPYYMPRLYKNDGKGNFTLDAAAIPKIIYTSAQAVAAGDYDGDGDSDLFIGGRVSPSQYPLSPRSYILKNNGGSFSDATEEVCVPLQEPGMITTAVWTDFNGDKKQDLIITGEWMPVRFFRNEGSRLEEVTSATGLKNMSGQWRSLAVADVDKDGDVDVIAGNLGLNNKYKASHEAPIKLFAKDIDGNGSVDPVLCYYMMNKKGKRELYPAADRNMLAIQVPVIKKKFLYHADYATQTASSLFSAEEKEDMLELTCEETRSVWMENKGGGKFELRPLPPEAQWSPVNAIVCTDVNKDGHSDLLLAGNEYQAEVMTGRYDASYGVFLKGDGKGGFVPIAPASTGFIIDGDVKDMKLVSTGTKERLVIAGVNDGKVRVFRIK